MSFGNAYRPDNEAPGQQQDVSAISHLDAVAPGIGRFFDRFAGTSFNRGLYRIHLISEMPRWTAIVADAFPEFKSRIVCFSCDWLGRHFAIDSGRRDRGQCQILMLEPGTGQALEIPATFNDFHDVELVTFQNEALAADFYRAWLDAGGAVPGPSQCIGYKKPLFLGGEDVVGNLEVIDMEVYWSVSAQLLSKSRGLRCGTKIGKIRIN